MIAGMVFVFFHLRRGAKLGHRIGLVGAGDLGHFVDHGAKVGLRQLRPTTRQKYQQKQEAKAISHKGDLPTENGV